MSRILLRAPKDPFEVVSPIQALRRDTIATNAGTLIQGAAASKYLSTEQNTVDVGQFRIRADDAGKINDRYDVLVLPMGNALRPGAAPTLRALTRLINRISIPVVVLGIGATGRLDGGFDSLGPIDDDVRGFVRAALEKGPALGVRGEYTRDYLAHLGFRETEVIGCPSAFLNGRGHRVRPISPPLRPDADLALSFSPGVSEMGPITHDHARRYPRLVAIPQNSSELRLLLRGDLPSDRGKSSAIPRYASHPLYDEDRLRFFVDPWPWIDYLRTMDFSFGSRLSGAIMSLLAGTPTVLIVHDSRTHEVARYLEIPHVLLRDTGTAVDAADLYECADPGLFNNLYEDRLETLACFLDKHDLDHAFRPGREANGFDRKVRKTSFPAPVRPLISTTRRQPTGHWQTGHRQRRLRRAVARLLGH